jgi:hypothetical protein
MSLTPFLLFAFLAEPESRVRPQPDEVRIGVSEGSFHHHSILLVEPWIADRIRANFRWTESSDLPSIAPSAFMGIDLLP